MEGGETELAIAQKGPMPEDRKEEPADEDRNEDDEEKEEGPDNFWD